MPRKGRIPRLLHVERSTIFRSAVPVMLRSANLDIDVVHVQSLEEATRVIQAPPPFDLVITSWAVYGLDVLLLVAELKPKPVAIVYSVEDDEFLRGYVRDHFGAIWVKKEDGRVFVRAVARSLQTTTTAITP